MIDTAQSRYDKANRVAYSLRLNKKTDADVLEALANSGNKTGLVREAIRAYIASMEGNMKPINDELKEILKNNNKYAILDTDNDVRNEIERLHTSGEIDYKEPEPNEEGAAETTGTARITVGKTTITAHYKVYLYDWDPEDEQYLSSSAEFIGWE